MGLPKPDAGSTTQKTETATAEVQHCGASYRCVTKLAMLYRQWEHVASAWPHEVALWDITTHERWTFRELQQRGAEFSSDDGPVTFPQGTSAEFILRTLAAWRTGQLCCPLDTGQPRPSFPPTPEGIVHIKLTSATTGTPRFVAFTAAQLIADAENIVQTMGLRSEWPNLGVISLAHSYGFSNFVLPLLLHGVPLILSDSALPEALRRASKLVPDLTLPAVPALWRVWHEANAIPAHVRLAISAGAPLPLPLEREVFALTGVKIHNFYGATECGGIAYDASETPRSDSAYVGAPLRNVDLRIAVDGCLEVHSAAVGETYWPRPEPNLSSGSFRTTDLAEFKEGLLYLRGRATDQINIAGRKISPETIERMLLTHSGVSDCLVLGAPSPDAGRSDILVACVVRRDAVDAESLRQFLLSMLPAWQVPREWKFVDSLSPGPRGKLSRAEWRAKLGYGSS
jgi:acyl-CoA synthetase (AMP-forming)/AMP-acid ligase II